MRPRISTMPAGSRPFVGSSRMSSSGPAERRGDAKTLLHARSGPGGSCTREASPSCKAAQYPDFLVAAEHDEDAVALGKMLQARRCAVTARAGEATVLVAAPGLSAADLNRLAAREGITLRQLAERTRSLERAFFALTGTDESGLRSAGQEMGAMR